MKRLIVDFVQLPSPIDKLKFLEEKLDIRLNLRGFEIFS